VPDDSELTRLRAEVRLLRDELAALRAAQEKSETRFAKMRAARNHAEKSAALLSESLADRLRIDGTVKGRKRSLLGRRQDSPSEDERRQLELIRSSPLFDAAWYLRHYHDVVRSGEEPALHFLRHPTRPIRAPGPDFDTARYLDAHPEVLASGENPLVHFLLSEEGSRADRYPPAP
jgi:hypothetical protein